MKDIHGRILVVPTADPQDTKMLAAVVDSFTILSKSVNTIIKKLNDEAAEFEKKSTGAEARIRRDQVGFYTSLDCFYIFLFAGECS